MTHDKGRKLIIAGTVASVLLVFFLLCVIIYQFIAISVAKERIAEYKESIEYYENVINRAEYDLEYYKSEYYLDQAARAYGYIYPEDR